LAQQELGELAVLAWSPYSLTGDTCQGLNFQNSQPLAQEFGLKTIPAKW
jgi:hypothetical protein